LSVSEWRIGAFYLAHTRETLLRVSDEEWRKVLILLLQD